MWRPLVVLLIGLTVQSLHPQPLPLASTFSCQDQAAPSPDLQSPKTPASYSSRAGLAMASFADLARASSGGDSIMHLNPAHLTHSHSPLSWLGVTQGESPPYFLSPTLFHLSMQPGSNQLAARGPDAFLGAAGPGPPEYARCGRCQSRPGVRTKGRRTTWTSCRDLLL